MCSEGALEVLILSIDSASSILFRHFACMQAAAKHATESLTNVPVGIPLASFEADAQSALQQIAQWSFPVSKL